MHALRALGLSLAGLSLISACHRVQTNQAKPDAQDSGALNEAQSPPSSTPSAISSPEEPQEIIPKEIEASAPPPQEKVRYTVAAIGDSLTDQRSYSNSYFSQLKAACPGSRWDNFGVGGNMVNQMRRRFHSSVVHPRSEAGDKPLYQKVIIFGGVNDLYSDLTAKRTPERITGDLRGMYEAARDAGIEVIALTVAPWGGFKKWYNPSRAAATLEVNRWVQSQEGLLLSRVVDAYGLLSCGEPEFLCPEYEKPFKDGLHFGQVGHAVLAKALLETAFPNCE